MHKTYILCRLCFTLSALTLLSSSMPIKAQSVDNKSAGVEWSGHGLKLELGTMSTDLVRAFFLGRGFSLKDADFIAKTGCVFRSAMGHSADNSDNPPITIELEKWQIITKKAHHSPRTREAWAAIWNEKKISDDAKIAFHWALYPTRQTYQSTDYNWGMISFALPPGTKFDLKTTWLEGETVRTKTLYNLECGK